jgi:hypothetical protein
MAMTAFQRVQGKDTKVKSFLMTHTPGLYSQLVTMWRNTDWDKWVKWEADPWSNVTSPDWKSI